MGNKQPQPPNTYKVRIINDGRNLRGQAKGNLQVTDTDILLTIKVNPRKKIEWPLRHLRRYGCEGNIFSIQAGSKCQTGEGMFAFRTKHAQEVFNLVAKIVQERQQMTGSTNDLLDHSSSPPSSAAIGRTQNSFVNSTESVTSPNSKQASPAAVSMSEQPSLVARPNPLLPNAEAAAHSGSNSLLGDKHRGGSTSPTKQACNLKYTKLHLSEPPANNGVKPAGKPRVSYTPIDFDRTENLHRKIDQEQHESRSRISSTNIAQPPNSYANVDVTATSREYKNLSFPSPEATEQSAGHNYHNWSAQQQQQTDQGTTNHSYHNWTAQQSSLQPQPNSYSNMTYPNNGSGSLQMAASGLNYAKVNFDKGGGQTSASTIPPATSPNSHTKEQENGHIVGGLVFKKDTADSAYSEVDRVATEALHKAQRQREEEREERKRAESHRSSS